MFLTAKPKFFRLIILKNQIQAASKSENIDTKAIKLAKIAPTAFIISIAPFDIASNTLLNFLYFIIKNLLEKKKGLLDTGS